MMKFKLVLITIFSLTTMGYLSAQSGINLTGNGYVHSNSEVGVHGNLIFNNNGAGTYPGIIITNRDSQNPGAIAFGERGSWENANDSQHVDGFVSVYNNSAFTFPIGNLGYYKPVSISGGFGTKASYTFDNPFKLASIGNAVTSRAAENHSETSVTVSEVEYWDIRGDKETAITLYWDTNSDIELLTNNDLSNLTVVGWNGSSWETLSSSVDQNVLNISQSLSASTGGESNMYSGSITTESIVPNNYEVFTFAAISGDENNGNVKFGSELSNNERIELTLFPNPVNNIADVNIDYNVSEVISDSYLEVFNEVGEVIYRKQLLEDKGFLQLPLNVATSGMYHIGISTESGSKVFKPVVITN